MGKSEVRRSLLPSTTECHSTNVRYETNVGGWVGKSQVNTSQMLKNSDEDDQTWLGATARSIRIDSHASILDVDAFHIIVYATRGVYIYL